MAGFAVEDALLKSAALTLPVGEILILFGLGGTAVFAALATARGERLFTPDVLSTPMRVRAVFEVTGRLFYTLAIATIPLSAATVILQATPLVVVAGAALVFGERVGWRRWTAILVGLSGVVLIVRPGTEGFSALSILAILGMLGFAGRDLASRAAPASLGTAVLGVYGFLAVIVAGAAFSAWDGAAFVRPGGPAALALSAAVLTGVAAYGCLMNAMRTGEVSAVTPFRYSRIVFGLAIGIAVFGERPDLLTYAGAGLIAVAGVFTLSRTRRAPPPQP